MTDAPRPPNSAQLLGDLQPSAELRYQPVAKVGLDPQLGMLRGRQPYRLARNAPPRLAACRRPAGLQQTCGSDL